MEYRQAIQEL